MDVLKVICTNACDAALSDSDESVDVPLKYAAAAGRSAPIEIIESDSEEEEEDDKKQRLFGSHVAAFSFDVLSGTGSIQDDEMLKRIPRAGPSEKEEGRTSPIETIQKELPKLSNTLMPVIRSFITCPLCMQPFPILSVKEEASPTAKTKKRKKVKPVRLAVTGAARMLHVQICASHKGITSDIVESLISRERIRLDRNRREEYNATVNEQRLWKTLTGDEPPCTQAQIAATTRKRPVKTPATTPAKMASKGGCKTKKPDTGSSPATFKAGKRGGLSRASTTILAPHLTREEVKKKCYALFGPSQEATERLDPSNATCLYDFHQLGEGTSRHREGIHLLGLGVGVCSANRDSDCPEARLGMGYNLASTIADRFRETH